MNPLVIVLLVILSPFIAAAYYLIVCFSLLGIVLLRETSRFVRVQQAPASQITEAQFAAICQASMRSIFDHNGAMAFLYPFLLFVTRRKNR